MCAALGSQWAVWLTAAAESGASGHIEDNWKHFLVCSESTDSQGCKLSRSRQVLEYCYKVHGRTCTQLTLLRSTKSGPDSRENAVFLPPTSPSHEYSGNMTTFLKGGHPSPWASLDSKQGKRASKIFFA